METVTIELNNSRAFSLLKELEELDLLRIVRKQPQTNNMADLLLLHQQRTGNIDE